MKDTVPQSLFPPAYPNHYEIMRVGRKATVPSGAWSNASGEPKPAIYALHYGYDLVGNRTAMQRLIRDVSSTNDEYWTFTYNGPHQLVERKQHSALYPTALTQAAKWHYTYDVSGNLAEATKENESAVQTERWLYEWNPRDQLIRAEKRTGTGSGTYAGKVEYEYCLSCDGALSARREYGAGSSSVPTSWKRYEYDGLNLLRVDEKYDISGGSLDVDDPWRTLEVSTHRPGALGALLSKRVFTHTDNNDAADATDDYVYVYDPVGNVWVILASDGHELYHFTQDAFGNELTISPFNGTSWNTARTAGITEHQTGKWIDPFTGLYYFSARWYDSGVGRFVGRDKINGGFCDRDQHYTFSRNQPTVSSDPSGLFAVEDCRHSGLSTYLRIARASCVFYARSIVTSDNKLSECIAGFCTSGRVQCTQECCEKRAHAQAHLSREYKRILQDTFYRRDDNARIIGKPDSGGCHVTLCPRSIREHEPFADNTWFIQLLVHEFSHCCGCGHWDMDNYQQRLLGPQPTGRCKGVKDGL